jgi:RNA polymerase sigma factor (sigma-70 family)
MFLRMINSNLVNRPIDMLLEEGRLVRQAKSGDVNAFVQLYDASVDRVYRYIHFLVPTDRLAEGLTFQTFFKAWEQLDRYQILWPSFIVWLYSIAQNQVNAYFRTHKKAVPPDNDFLLAARGGEFSEEFRTIRESLRFLTAEEQQVLVLKFIVGMPNKTVARMISKRESEVRVLQMHALRALTEDLKDAELKINIKGFQKVLEDCLTRLLSSKSTMGECLERYPQYAYQLGLLFETVLLLNLGHNVKPSPTFNAYTRTALVQYVRTHPRQPRVVMPRFQRLAMAVSLMVFTVLATGTAQAQIALPGDALYSWKLTSENVWLAISLNQLSTKLALSERRLTEWIAVSDDPVQSEIAMNSYLNALAGLQGTEDMATLVLIVPVLQSQQETLDDAGLGSSQLDNYLNEVVAVLPPPTPTAIPPTATNIPPTATNIPPTATHIPPTATDVPPTATNVPPTEVLPTDEPTPQATPIEP